MVYVIDYKTSTKNSMSHFVKSPNIRLQLFCHAKTANHAKNMTLYMHDNTFKESDK